ncbi:MAG: family peptidase [Dehalococcoidia bacterium]|nr:family peptidase [Dehalococcoidia bacterium]
MKRILRLSIFSLLLLSVVALSFGMGVTVGQGLGPQGAEASVVSRGHIKGVADGEPKQFGLLDEIWKILDNDFVDKKALDRDKLGAGAIQGVIDSLGDSHTIYIDAESYQEERVTNSGIYEGIGAHVTNVEGRLTIIAPIAGSPAESAGVKAGDVVVSVNGESIAGLTLSQAVSKIKGPRGTTVAIEVMRAGEDKPITLEIRREEIKAPSVSFKLLPDKIAHLRITQFTQRTGSELKDVLKEIRSQGVTGIVIDLRNNPGGLLDTTIETTSQFIKDGAIAYQVDRDGNKERLSVRRGGTATDIPLAVLVNGGSASGSEIMAGAIQDFERGPLIGLKTFGKGSVNNLRELSDGSALYVTTARWLTPKGRLIEGNGLTPDIEVDFTREDLTAGRDPQLERAVEHLKSVMK